MQRKKDVIPKGKSEIPMFLSGADEAVVVTILSDNGRGAINDLCFKLNDHRMSNFSIYQMAGMLNPKIRGWINYYGKFGKSEIWGMFKLLNLRLARWVRLKYKKFRKKHLYISHLWLEKVAKAFPHLFVHWQHGFLP